MNKIYLLHIKPHCEIGLDIEWAIPYRINLSDETIRIRPDDPCEHSCSATECKDCLANFRALAAASNLTLALIAERLG